MKKHRKHNFKHNDPEKLKDKNISEEKSPQKRQTQILAERDFKKVIISIGIFVLLIVLYIFLDKKADFGQYLPKI